MRLFDFLKSKKENKGRDSQSSPIGNHSCPGVCGMPLDAKYTPDNITELGCRDIFVFGSNLAGHHAGGAARAALNRFGAIWGQGEGLQGNSYAIPTMQGGIETIKPYVNRFIDFAKKEKTRTFYVTKIGCGIAGFKPHEIALLFRDAIGIDNIRLPKEFVDIICQNKVTDGERTDLLLHAHGVTRTFADLVISRNKEVGFDSPGEVMSFLQQYFERFMRNGDDVAFIAVRIFWSIVNKAELFKSGQLDISELRKSLLETSSFSSELDKAYELHCREKLFNVIVYLNEFRRYCNAEDIINDVNRSKITDFSHCGSNYDYFMSPLKAGNGYPLFYFKRFLTENWRKLLKSDGTLDEKLLDELMFKKHECDLRKYGLEAVISHDYNPYPCWGAFVPKTIGTGPVYIELDEGGYAISCGEGAGPNHIPHSLEYTITSEILKTDSRYDYIDGYYIPKTDMSLPILGTWRDTGIVHFSNMEEKLNFVANIRAKSH